MIFSGMAILKKKAKERINLRSNSPRDSLEIIESLQRRCCEMLHYPALFALFSGWFSGLFPRRK